MARGNNFWLGMMVGAAAGAITALLYAPKSGEKMRHDIKESARETGKKAGEAWGGVKERTSKMAGKSRRMMEYGKSRVAEAVRAGRQAAEEKGREMRAELEEAEKKA